jgi:multiple sugar transport system substrate-binding protein
MINKLVLSASILALAASSTSPAMAQDYSRFGIEKDLPGTCNYAAIDTKDYSGRSLNIITHAIPVIGEPTALHAEQFAELTGAEVNVVHVPFGDLFQRIMIPFQSGQNAYDVMFYASLWIGDFNRFLEPVPEAYATSTGMSDVTPSFTGVATWNGQMIQYPMDGDRHYLKYRTDIFDNDDVKAKYLAETGSALSVPETWEDYNKVAAYFNNSDWDGDGELNYGSAEVAKRDDLMFSAFISRAAPYAKHPDVKGGFFFDLETMEPLINSPGFVRGLELFIQAQTSFPPGGENFGLGDEIFSFGGGQALMSYSWDDAYIQANQEDSRIRNKVAAAPLPGAGEVWNRKTGVWDKFDTPNRAPYMTWGWSSAVSSISEEKEMAFDFLCFFSNEANAKNDLQIGRFGVNPYRNSHFDVDFWKGQGWADKTAETYVKTLSEMEDSQNRVFDLRVPGVSQFMSSMANGVAEAMAGQKTAQEALNGVAKEWAEITDRIGKDRLREAYANVVKLEDNEGR